MRARTFCFIVSVAVAITVVDLVLAPSASAQNKFDVLHVFTWAKNPQGSLIFDAAGNLYGTTDYGAGSGCSGNGCGAVWRMTPNSNGRWTLSLLHVFHGMDGSTPANGVIFDAAGNLYGAALGGGGHNGCAGGTCGAVFKLTHNPSGTWTESILHSFTGPDGGWPQGLTFDASGNLYGTARISGTAPCLTNKFEGCGVVFKLTPNSDGTWTESVLYSFTGGADGAWPTPYVLIDPLGNLYGATSLGGAVSRSSPGDGVVFKLTPNPNGTWTESVLHAFTGADGNGPVALIFDSAGNLYGATSDGGSSNACGQGLGCGIVFKLTPNSDGTWTETVLHNFTGADGAFPAGLTFDAAGSLYGTTNNGGTHDAGVVFKLKPNSNGTWSESVLHTFVGFGSIPEAPVIFDHAGNLYGTTLSGSNNSGLVFEITP